MEAGMVEVLLGVAVEEVVGGAVEMVERTYF